MSNETVTLYRVQANRSSAKIDGLGFTYLENFCKKGDVDVTAELVKLGYAFDKKFINIFCFFNFFREHYVHAHDDPDDDEQPESFRLFWESNKLARKCIFAFQSKDALAKVLLAGKSDEDVTILKGFLHWTLKTNNLCILEIKVLKSDEGKTWISDGVIGKQVALLRSCIQSERLLKAEEAINFVFN